MNLYKLDEAPFHKTTWVRLDEAAAAVGRETEDLRKVCKTVGATIIAYKGWTVIDFDVLGKSAAWRQLMTSKKAQDTQGDLFRPGEIRI